MMVRFLENITTVFQSYEVFLVDAWGVLHDGKSLYPGAGEMLEQLMDAGKKVIILSSNQIDALLFRRRSGETEIST